MNSRRFISPPNDCLLADATTRIAEYLVGSLRVEELDGLLTHAAVCATCRDKLTETWRQLGRIPPAEFDAVLDLGNSFEVVKEMRWVPFTMSTVFQLGVTTLTPVLPLMLTMISLEDLLTKLLQMVF
jgi:hypothetical protein